MSCDEFSHPLFGRSRPETPEEYEARMARDAIRVQRAHRYQSPNTITLKVNGPSYSTPGYDA